MADRKITRFENPFLYDRKEGESTEHYYKRLAKQADQRLVRLEKLTSQEGYTNVNKYAYARAMRDIKQWSGEGATRFNMKPPKNTNQLRAKIADIRTFLEAPTSTKAGIESVYKNRADTINEKYGTSFDWTDLANYFDEAKNTKSDSKYGSDTMLKAVAEIQKQSDTITKQIKQHKKKHITVDNPRLQDAIDDILADRGIDIKSFI